jgi:hypothetical protein
VRGVGVTKTSYCRATTVPCCDNALFFLRCQLVLFNAILYISVDFSLNSHLGIQIFCSSYIDLKHAIGSAGTIEGRGSPLF